MSTDRPLRVLQVVQRYLPELGGTETHVAEVTRRLNRRDDVEVTVLATDRSGALARSEVLDGTQVLRRRSWPRRSDLYLAPAIAPVIARGGWDVVHFQGVHTLVPPLGMLAARAARIPYVLSFHSGGHSSPARSAVRGAQWRVLTPLLRRASRLIAVSRFERGRFAAITGIAAERFTVIGNGGALPPVPEGVLPVPGRVVSSGRLERYKGHHRVIESLPALRELVPGAHVVILGSGAYEGELHALAARLGVGGHVSIRALPPADRAAMATELAGASVMAALSEYEAHPVGVMEAVATGLPVLGADVAGTGDFVADGQVTGIAVDAPPAEVAHALAAIMAGVAPGPRTPPSIQLPTWEHAADALARVYTDTARRTPGGPAEQPGRDLRVVHVITTLSTGGAERQLEAITARRPATTVALYSGGLVADAMSARGQDVRILGMHGWRKPLAVLRLARLLRTLAPDVVHVHLLAAQLWGIPAARLAGVPVVISTEHSLMATSIENRPLSGWLRRVYLTLARLATRTVAVSATTSERLQAWGVGENRITVVANGIDFAHLAFDPPARRAVRAELGIDARTSVVGAVGRLEPVKRFPELLAMVAPTLRRGARELVVVGDGPLRESLRRTATELGVADAVHLLGPRPDVPAVLSAMDVLVSPSRDETFGLAVIEALGSGLPVLYAQCPALENLDVPLAWAVRLGDGAGHYSPGHEASDLRIALARLLAASPTAGARLPVPSELVRRYGVDSTVAALEQLYTHPGRAR